MISLGTNFSGLLSVGVIALVTKLIERFLNPRLVLLWMAMHFLHFLFLTSNAEQALNQSPIVITEVVAGNSTDHKEDWLEIINTSEAPVSLARYAISDTPDQEGLTPLPDISLTPGERLVLLAAGKKKSTSKNVDGSPTSVILPFKLNADGESLFVFAQSPDNNQNPWIKVSQFSFPGLEENQAYGFHTTTTSGPHRGLLETPTPNQPNANIDKIWFPKKAWSIEPASHLTESPHEIHPAIDAEVDGIDVRFTIDGTDPAGKSSQPVSNLPSSINKSTVLRFGFYHNDVEVAPQQSRTYLFHGNLLNPANERTPPLGWPEYWGENATYYGPPQKIVDSWNWDHELKDGFESIPIFSVIIDLDHLFDYGTGIYANSFMKGKDWERHCLLEYIPARKSNKSNAQANAGIRIRGGFSRNPNNPKHSVRFFFRESYGDEKLIADIHSSHPDHHDDPAIEFDHLDLRCSQNYSWSFGNDPSAVFVRDQFNRDLQLRTGQPGPRGDFCHLFINGLYWGLYNSSERPEASFGDSYIKGKKADFDVIKSAGFNWGGRYAGTRDDRPTGPSGRTMHIEATDGDLEAWHSLWSLTQNEGGMANMNNYLIATGKNPDGSQSESRPALLDSTNLIDYMLIILGMGNRDAPLTSGGDRPNNWYALRNKNGKEGFKFIIWDAEHSVLTRNIFEDRNGPWFTGDLFEYSNPQYLWEQCLKNPQFRLEVRDRVHKHFSPGGILTTPVLTSIWERRVAEISSAVVAESARWGARVAYDPYPGNILTRENHWLPAVYAVKTEYFPRRPSIFFGQLQSAGLTHSLPAPDFSPQKDATPLNLHKDTQLVWIPESVASDPRQTNNSPHPDATISNASSPNLPQPNTPVQARFKLNNNWGPITSISP